ncbi:helix-turn-helix domain-containing protein [Streptomyces sp. RKAG293]|uniref:winged helix-turn-helix transcriptional regulator n=1 Tax=Streptomyces sp. RKAG293 TaxID=2893403 RepID=UPI002033C1C4|nr:helix-turn-helix domain-containing protein [Streptomyces sp. RKAG293]MCM2417412.1 helix-turn-helix transcriptional regulator [Streptomyces sp. RKAG293]
MDDAAPTRLPPGGQNAIAVALGLLGDEWTLLILRYALQGVRRYQDWHDRLPISNAVLTARLTRLTDMGLLVRDAYQQRPVRYAYQLTPRGREIWPVLVSIWGWEYRWVDAHSERLPWMRHRGCGRHMEPVMVCGGCEQPVRPREVSSVLGPSGAAGRSIPSGATRRRSAAGAESGAGLFPETMSLIGNRWSVGLLGAAFLGAHRFGEFQQRLGAPPAMIADRLRTFCALGVLEALPGEPGRGSYRLTAKGRAFFPVVMTLIDWGQHWFLAPEGPALLSTHLGCGADFAPRLVCDGCRQVLCDSDVQVIGEEPAAPVPVRAR